MGDTFEFESTGHTKASPDAVFEALADAPTWAKWGRPIVRQAKFTRTASPDPKGVGSVRAVGSAPVWVKERTTVYEPGREFGYELVGFAPMRDYNGHVTLTASANGGTDIRWHGRFAEKIPGSGPVLRAGLGLLIKTFLGKLTRYLDARS